MLGGKKEFGSEMKTADFLKNTAKKVLFFNILYFYKN